jgi:hypothetical protein
MKILKIIPLFLILVSAEAYAQFSLDTFLSDSLTKPISVVKKALNNEKTTENTKGKFDRITYFSWLNPVSIKVDYMFKKDGGFAARSISNAKDTKEDGQQLFNIVDSLLTKKYGKSMTHRSLLGVEMYGWAGVGGALIGLTKKGDSTKLVFMIFR